ncbi:hypothetical protein HRS9139_07814 [Pyrenophora teres f. teres]|uniref:Uncharacterized protein n=2 Tax=Pyrenophora teres f. teres TaxID=97479 RepID=A0A6S6WEW9_9PLEO|nr:hypothetical protein HRS9139_07814 [Pyrenophora teres f. teres]CAE7217295.1 hypothetical protein PTTW11_10942 [Pyrenophora teres f. teres]
MWKRLQGHGREKERPAPIGNPVPVETPYNEDQLSRNRPVADSQNGSHQDYAFPPLASYQLSPQYPPNYRSSEAPSASTYSQPSPNPYQYENPTAPSYCTYEDISPPSSPEPDLEYSSSSNQPRRFRSMRDVSPMDENRKHFEREGHVVSHIPVLRRAPSILRNGESAMVPKQKFWDVKLAPNSKMKWDEYSGEPNMAGKAASVDPGSYAKGASTQPMGYQVSVTAGVPEKGNTGFGARVGRFGSKRSPPPVEPFARATGRSEIAPPLKYQPASKPVQTSRKPVSPSQDRDHSNALAAAIDFASKLGDTQPVTAETRDVELHNKQPIKPTVPLKIGKKSPSQNGLSSPTSPTHKGLGIFALAYSSPVIETNTTPKEQHQPLHPAYRTATSPYTTAASKLRDDHDNNTHPLLSYTNTNTGLSKALPQPPTHLSALDHIQLLESQQDDLRIRRNNVYRLLNDVNNAAPPNPLLTDFKKARLADQRKKAFELELDQIRQEEHDVGLKLHRAWKKREREDPHSAGSALWVRRVTA